MSKIAPYGKAITATIVAFLTTLQQALDDGGVSAGEWTGVALATVIAGGAVWAVPNAVRTVRRKAKKQAAA
jgi:hypothetical protein